MRFPTKRQTLLVLYGIDPLSLDILDQRAASRDVQCLHPITDRENRQVEPFGFIEHEEVGFILLIDHRLKLRMRFLPVSQRVNVRITAWKQNAIQLSYHRANVTPVGNQRNMHRQSATRFYGFTVVTPEIKSPRRELQPHC